MYLNHHQKLCQKYSLSDVLALREMSPIDKTHHFLQLGDIDLSIVRFG